jgi:hypothetical protein
VAIIESTKKTLTRLLAPTSNLTWLRIAVRNHKIGIATTVIWLRADYKVKEDSLRFPMVHSRTSTSQQIKSYDFRKMAGLLKTSFLYRLQCRKRNKFWDCLVGILPLIWIPKTWRTLLSFRRLLIQPHPTNGLEDTEFWRLTSLLISVSGQNCGWTELNFWVLDWPKLRKPWIPLR